MRYKALATNFETNSFGCINSSFLQKVSRSTRLKSIRTVPKSTFCMSANAGHRFDNILTKRLSNSADVGHMFQKNVCKLLDKCLTRIIMCNLTNSNKLTVKFGRRWPEYSQNLATVMPLFFPKEALTLALFPQPRLLSRPLNQLFEQLLSQVQGNSERSVRGCTEEQFCRISVLNYTESFTAHRDLSVHSFQTVTFVHSRL